MHLLHLLIPLYAYPWKLDDRNIKDTPDSSHTLLPSSYQELHFSHRTSWNTDPE